MTCIADVTAERSGFRLEVLRYEHREATVFGARLRDGDDRIVSIVGASATADAAIESAVAWLVVRDLPHVATALTQSARAELVQ